MSQENIIKYQNAVQNYNVAKASFFAIRQSIFEIVKLLEDLAKSIDPASPGFIDAAKTRLLNQTIVTLSRWPTGEDVKKYPPRALLVDLSNLPTAEAINNAAIDLMKAGMEVKQSWDSLPPEERAGLPPLPSST